MKEFMMRKTVRHGLIAAALFWLLAAFFRFALVGYTTLAQMFFCSGVVIVLYLVLPFKLRIVLTVLLCLGVALFIVAEVPVIRAAGGSGDVDADYVIVLGAGVNGDTPSLSMLNRLRTALSYLEAHRDCVAVVTGGQGKGENITEAEAMARWLRDQGIEEHRIIQENRASNTKENIVYSFELIPDADKATIAVVSSEYHLCRAEAMARAIGHTLYGIPAHTTRPLLMVNHFIREALGMAHFWLLGY